MMAKQKVYIVLHDKSVMKLFRKAFDLQVQLVSIKFDLLVFRQEVNCCIKRDNRKKESYLKLNRLYWFLHKKLQNIEKEIFLIV